MIKIRKDSYLRALGVQAALAIVLPIAPIVLLILILAEIPYAGNLWLGLVLMVALLFFGLGLLTYCIRHDRRGDRWQW